MADATCPSTKKSGAHPDKKFFDVCFCFHGLSRFRAGSKCTAVVQASAALSVGAVHGGLNLYNNGFAAGIVAAVLVPVIMAIRAGKDSGEGATGQKGAAKTALDDG